MPTATESASATTAPTGSSTYSPYNRYLRYPVVFGKAPFFLSVSAQVRSRSDISTRQAASQVRQAPVMCSSTIQAGSPVKYWV